MITIIIQGKLNIESLNNIDYYLSIGNVIISCYDNDDLSLLDLLKDKKGIEIILNKYPIGDFFNYGNIYLQAYLTLNGLIHCKSEYVIKVRSDEYFKKLDLFVDALVNNSNNLTVCNVFFRRDAMYKFHISDHIIGGTTRMLTGMFQYC
jgi:hypothetical protein